MPCDVALALTTHDDLLESPIRPEWILEGSPVARMKSLGSNGYKTQLALWDCTAGSFRWEFGPFDESVHILEGTVRVTGADGVEHLLQAGDAAVFGAGTTSLWVVETYVKKLAVLHDRRSRGRRLSQLAVGRLRPGRPSGLGPGMPPARSRDDAAVDGQRRPGD